MSNNDKSSSAFGAPGMPPRWTSSAKDGIGTAYNTASRLWFTLSHGIVNEIYYPTVDQPNTRDMQLLVTDGETFFHEERCDLEHGTHYPEQHSLYYRLISKDPQGRYEIVKDLIADPHQPVLLMKVRIRVKDAALRKKIKAHVLLAPHLKGAGKGNSAAWSDRAGQPLLRAWKEDVHLVLGARPGLQKRSVGYVGASDGWQDLHRNYSMDWQFTHAENGNVAMMAELDPGVCGDGVVIGVGFGASETSATTNLLQSLAGEFDQQVRNFVKQWQRLGEDCCDHADRVGELTNDGGSFYRLSRSILLAHEDKTYQGAIIASLSIPWGDAQDDENLGGYHLVWPRDMLNSALALLAAGHLGTPQRALTYLATIQGSDGGMPQNCWLDGEPYWLGVQLDEIAAPLILAWHVSRRNDAGRFDVWPMMQRGAARIMLNGPVTEQDRWEENSGYSPSTLAAAIAALVAAADAAMTNGEQELGAFIFSYADWMASHLEDWCVTTAGKLCEGIPRHYVRITPASTGEAPPYGHVNSARIHLANGGGEHAASEVVGGDFLTLVRYGIRPANDPVITDSVKVIDQVIRHELPNGAGWQRYNFDGYGQKQNGDAFDGTGTGGCWPLLSGERAMYELARGEDVSGWVRTLEGFANGGGMLPEQVWQFDDIPEKRLYRGAPTGSAMPLCWAHAEYLNLVRSAIDGVPFDRVIPAYERYVKDGKRDSEVEIWTLNHPVGSILAGRKLRVILPACAFMEWSVDGWQDTQRTAFQQVMPGVWYADIPTDTALSGTAIDFTLHRESHWKRDSYRVIATAPQ